MITDWFAAIGTPVWNATCVLILVLFRPKIKNAQKGNHIKIICDHKERRNIAAFNIFNGRRGHWKFNGSYRIYHLYSLLAFFFVVVNLVCVSFSLNRFLSLYLFWSSCVFVSSLLVFVSFLIFLSSNRTRNVRTIKESSVKWRRLVEWKSSVS